MNREEKEIWRKIHKQANYTNMYRYENDTKFDCELLPSFILKPCIATDNLCIRLLKYRGIACFGRVSRVRRGIEVCGFENQITVSNSEVYVALLFCVEKGDVSMIQNHLHSLGIYAFSSDKKSNVRVLLKLETFKSLLSEQKLKLLGIWAPNVKDPVIPHLLWCMEVCSYRWWYCHTLSDIEKCGFRASWLNERINIEMQIVKRLLEFEL